MIPHDDNVQSGICPSEKHLWWWRERERERVSVGDMGRLRMLEKGFGFGSISDAGERFAFGSNAHVVLLVN